MKGEREIALQILRDVEEKDAYANLALSHALELHAVGSQDRRFITELVYGTIKMRLTLDWVIGQFASRPLAEMTVWVRNILRLGVYQLLFLDKVPAAAACNEAAELTKRYGHAGTVRFVNGILRTIARNRDKIVFPSREEDPVAHITIVYSHPAWLVRRWVNRMGVEATIALCAANNVTPPLTVRTNTLRITREELAMRLQADGVAATPTGLAPEGLVIDGFSSLARLSPLGEGLCQVQDESSMLVAHVVDPAPGETVIDACGAPGGKTTHLAERMANRGRIIALDIHEHKLALTRDNCRRLGIDIVETRCMDARELQRELTDQADRVLVDAPCSGLGVLRRKPDTRWRKTPALVAELPRLQGEILSSAARCLRPGGVLVYSTCTLEPEENEHVVNRFLALNHDFILEQTGMFLPRPRRDSLVQLYPHIDGVDGFFVARMRKHGKNTG